MSLTVLALSVLVGLSLGLLGGGGTILTVPILLYVAGLEPKQAIATSLLVVALASAQGVVSHARAGRVEWRTGILFGLAGMAGAYAGGRVAHFIPGGVLLLLFAAMMAVTAVAMMRSRDRGAGPATDPEAAGSGRKRPIARILGEGVAVGLVTGLVGAGGGFLVVPALATLGGLPMKAAVATSLVVVSMKSFAGLLGYLGHVEIDFGLALMVSAAAVVGSVIGTRLVKHVSPTALRRAFAWFVLVMAAALVAKELPKVWASPTGPDSATSGGLPWLAGVLALAVAGLAVYLLKRKLGASSRSELPALKANASSGTE